MIGPNQQPRLLGLLEKLRKFKHGDPQSVAERDQRFTSSEFTGFGGQEHRDIITLYNNGLIKSVAYTTNPENQWSSLGIFDYEITEDGEDYLIANSHNIEQTQTPASPAINQPPRVFIIHGTDPNGYVPQVEQVCRQLGLNPFKMMDEPNQGSGLPDKLRATMTDANYFVAVLTADETTIGGTQRARPNAYSETVTANVIKPKHIAILREGNVEITTDLQGLAYIQLEGQWSMRLLQEFKSAGLL